MGLEDEIDGLAIYEPIIIEKARELMKDGDFVSLKGLLMVSGVELPVDLVEEAYDFFAENYPGRIVSLMKLTQVKPSEKVVKDAYVTIGNKYWFDDLVPLITVTGIKPSEELVEEAYNYFLGFEEFSNLRSLMNATGFSPSEESVQEFVQINYNSFLKYRKYDAVRSVADITKIKPSEELVQSFGKQFLINGYLAGVKLLIDVAGFSPPEELVQEIYKDLLKNDPPRMDYVGRLMEMTGVKPRMDLEMNARVVQYAASKKRFF